MQEKDYKRELRSVRRTLEGALRHIDMLLSEEPKEAFESLPLKEQINYLLDGVCDYWSITREDLTKKSVAMARKRQYAVVLLRDYTPLTQVEIGELMGYSDHSTANTRIQRMDERLSKESYGDSRMRAIYEGLISYLKLPESKYYRR